MTSIWISLIILSLIAIFVPKYISRIEVYATSTCFFALAFGALTDIILDLHYDLYGYYEKRFQLITLLIFLFVYPTISTLFLNFFLLCSLPRREHVFLFPLPLVCWLGERATTSRKNCGRTKKSCFGPPVYKPQHENNSYKESRQSVKKITCIQGDLIFC